MGHFELIFASTFSIFCRGIIITSPGIICLPQLLINYYHRKTNLFCLSAFKMPLCSFLSSCLCSLSPSIHCTVPSSPALLALYLSLLPKCIQNVIRHFIVVFELRHFRFEMCLKQHTDMSKMCAV